MNSFAPSPEELAGAENFDQVLATYKKLNNIINSYDQWEKSIIEKEERLRTAEEEFNKKRKYHDEELGLYLNSLRALEKSIQEASKGYVNQSEDIKKRENQLKSSQDAVANLEKQLFQREEAMKAKEMELMEREEYIGNREAELEEKGDMLRQLESQVIQASTQKPSTRGENTDTKSKKQESEVLTFRDEAEEAENEKQYLHEVQAYQQREEVLMKRVKMLEEENYKLYSQNNSLQQELMKVTMDMANERGNFLREKELIVNKENSIKQKEQNLKKREGELVEKTRFLNSMIQTVNSQLKNLKTQPTIGSQDSESQERHLIELKTDPNNISSMLYGDTEKENSYEDVVRYQGKVPKASLENNNRYNAGQLDQSN